MPRPITIDLIPRKKNKGAQVLLEIRQIATNFYVALSFLPVLIFLALYGAMFFYSSQLEKDIKDIKSDVVSIEKGIDLDKKQEVQNFAERLDIIKFFLDNHVKTSSIFKIIEGITHKEVAFISFNFSTKDGSVTMDARTRNYRTLAEQIIVLEQNRNINSVEISGVKLGLEGVTFNVSFNINREIYNP